MVHHQGCWLPTAPGPCDRTCSAVRELFGLCPEHDGWCTSRCQLKQATDRKRARQRHGPVAAAARGGDAP